MAEKPTILGFWYHVFEAVLVLLFAGLGSVIGEPYGRAAGLIAMTIGGAVGYLVARLLRR